MLCTSPLKGSLENAFRASVGEVISLQAVAGFKQTFILDSGCAEWSLGLYLITVGPQTMCICVVLHYVNSVNERGGPQGREKETREVMNPRGSWRGQGGVEMMQICTHDIGNSNIYIYQ